MIHIEKLDDKFVLVDFVSMFRTLDHFFSLSRELCVQLNKCYTTTTTMTITIISKLLPFQFFMRIIFVF